MRTICAVVCLVVLTSVTTPARGDEVNNGSTSVKLPSSAVTPVINNAVKLPEAPSAMLARPAAYAVARRPIKEGLPAWDFWLSHGVFYASIFADGQASITGSRKGCFEGNALFQGDDHKFSAGKYYAVNIPAAIGVTLFDHWLRKQAKDAPADRGALRILSHLVPALGSAAHLIQVKQWHQVCP